jgi:hypothetical protein
MRSSRTRRRPGRRAVVAARAPVAGVHRKTNRAELVPGPQREHRGRLPGAPRPCQGGEPARALLHERRARPRALRARTRRGAASCAGTVRSAQPRTWRPPARDGRSLSLAPPSASEPLSARTRRGALHRRRAAPWPAARLRGDRAAVAAPLRVVRRRARRATSARWFATATRSTLGPTKSGTSGAPRTCPGSDGLSSAPPGPGDSERVGSRRAGESLCP